MMRRRFGSMIGPPGREIGGRRVGRTCFASSFFLFKQGFWGVREIGIGGQEERIEEVRMWFNLLEIKGDGMGSGELF